MKILYLDTSSKFLSLAVAEDDKVLAQIHKLLDRKHSLQLVPLIAQILKQAKVSLKKLDGFCVGQGPGSFTGLRIGITAIKGLAFVLQKPVVAIPSLDILVQNVARIKVEKNKKLPGQICPIVDAKQNKVYAGLYHAQNGTIKRKSPYLVLPIEELLPKLKGEVLFLGDAILLYQEKICQSKSIKPMFAGEKFWYPKVSRAIPLARERFRLRKFNDVMSLVPLYLYPKECQIRKVIGRR